MKAAHIVELLLHKIVATFVKKGFKISAIKKRAAPLENLASPTFLL